MFWQDYQGLEAYCNPPATFRWSDVGLCSPQCLLWRKVFSSLLFTCCGVNTSQPILEDVADKRYTDKDGLKRTKKNMSRQSALKSAGMSSTGCGLKGHQLSSFFKMLQFVINWPRTFLDRNPGLQVSQKGLPAGDDMMGLMGDLRMSQG